MAQDPLQRAPNALSTARPSSALGGWPRLVGGVLALCALAPMAAALDALEAHDYLSGALLIGLTWVVARTGLDLAIGAAQGGEP